jgi:toxin CptA
MAFMHRPDPVEISLRPSRLTAAWTLVLAAATLSLSFTLPIDGWLNAVAAVLLAAWSVLALRRHAYGGRALRRFRLEGDRTLLVTTRDGRARRGRVLPASYVDARLTTVVWRPEGHCLARAECILPDALRSEDFRRLRVFLRYGRSEPTQGAPPSHA